MESSKFWISLLKGHHERFLGRPLFEFRGHRPQGLEEKPGIYAIYSQGTILYIGESRDSRRRIWTSHRSGRTKGDQFNRHLESKMGLNAEEKRREYIRGNCELRFLISDETGDLPTRKLVEAFLIAVMSPTLNNG